MNSASRPIGNQFDSIELWYKYSNTILGYYKHDAKEPFPKILKVEPTQSPKIKKTAPYCLVKDVPFLNSDERLLTGMIRTIKPNMFFGDFKGKLILVSYSPDEFIRVFWFPNLKLKGSVKKKRQFVNSFLRNGFPLK